MPVPTTTSVGRLAAIILRETPEVRRGARASGGAWRSPSDPGAHYQRGSIRGRAMTLQRPCSRRQFDKRYAGDSKCHASVAACRDGARESLTNEEVRN